jgi:hypothetical protein
VIFHPGSSSACPTARPGAGRPWHSKSLLSRPGCRGRCASVIDWVVGLMLGFGMNLTHSLPFPILFRLDNLEGPLRLDLHHRTFITGASTLCTRVCIYMEPMGYALIRNFRLSVVDNLSTGLHRDGTECSEVVFEAASRMQGPPYCAEPPPTVLLLHR